MPEVHYKNQTVTGNDAASYVAYVPPMGVSVFPYRYQFCDNCFIYPITPSTPMATNCDAYASRGMKNVFGQVG